MRKPQNWKTKDGERWASAEKRRAARLFRHHVRSPSNPTGRIHREKCWFCVQNALGGGYPRLEHLPEEAFHHIDYDRPFVGTYLCLSHHRQVDVGSLKIPARAIYDYTSLIEAPGVARPGGRRSVVTIELMERTLKKTERLPPGRMDEILKESFEKVLTTAQEKKRVPF